MNPGPNIAAPYDLAVTSYRRANGSQATTMKPRKQRPVSRNYPRASTPTPWARQRANAKRKADAWTENVLKMIDRQNANRLRRGY